MNPLRPTPSVRTPASGARGALAVLALGLHFVAAPSALAGLVEAPEGFRPGADEPRQDAPADAAPAPGTPGQDAASPRYRVVLLTMDRGDQVYEMFGHNALLIEDAATGQSLAWNWGLFNFEDVDFIPRFLRGTMRYSMGPADPEPFIASYRAAERQVYANEIHLTQAQAAELDRFVRWNFQPENRPYIYDYYRDNCSTRLRDALDLVLGGELRARFEDVPTGRSYRWYSRRLVQVTGWVDQGLSFLLGMRGDPPITAWEAMFLPVELMQYLEQVEITGEDGVPRPLLGPREVWVEAGRPPLPARPPGISLELVMLAVGAALLLGWLGGRVTAAPSHLGPRVALAVVATAWGLFAGALGLLLVLAWFTDHHFIQANLNLFYLSPLAPVAALLLLVALTSPARALGRWGQGAFLLAALIAGVSLVVFLLQVAGPLRQGNADVLLVGIPLNLGAAVAAWRVAGGRSTFRRLIPGTLPGGGSQPAQGPRGNRSA